MPDRTLDELLDEVVDAVVAGGDAPGLPDDVASAELRDLADVARALRHLPREEFRTRLESDLERSATMTVTTSYVPEGLGTVTPYLVVPDAKKAIRFYAEVFGGEELHRSLGPDDRIMHATVRIGNAVVELGEHPDVELAPPDPDRLPSVGMHLYVPDVDAVYERAVAAGATGREPVEQPYGDREATVNDPFGITWWVATHHGAG